MKTVLAVLVVLVVAALGAAYYLQRQDQQGFVEPAPIVEAPPGPSEPAGPRYPIPDAAVPPAISETPGESTQTPEEARSPSGILPPLNESNALMTEVLDGLFGNETVRELFNVDEIVRRFVVTVDTLTNTKLSRQHLLVKRAQGPFLVAGTQDQPVIGPDNAARYTPYVKLAAGIDAQQLVAVYVRYYPLFQEAYAELGNGDAYFNDRLVAVIDHLLDTPTVEAPIRLVQPHVFYQYADPELEALSAGQKILLRMGSVNAEAIKAKLREVRQLLTRGAPVR